MALNIGDKDDPRDEKDREHDEREHRERESKERESKAKDAAHVASQDLAATKDETENTVLLEMALYKNYRMGNVNYEKGTPYRFKRSDAMHLLTEHDMNRPLWRMYRKPVVAKRMLEHQVRDATRAPLPPREEPIHGLPIEELPARRIDIGTDDEIRDILDRSDEGGFGNVTV